jgi:hypothetical protein
VLDRRALHADALADEVREVGQRAPELAGERVDHGLGLLIRRAVVDEQQLPPVALQHVAGDEHGAHEREAAHVDAADPSLVEVVGDDRLADAAVGVLADPARAQHVAGADLEQRALQLVALASLRGGLLRGGGHLASSMRAVVLRVTLTAFRPPSQSAYGCT